MGDERKGEKSMLVGKLTRSLLTSLATACYAIATLSCGIERAASSSRLPSSLSPSSLSSRRAATTLGAAPHGAADATGSGTRHRWNKVELVHSLARSHSRPPEDAERSYIMLAETKPSTFVSSARSGKIAPDKCPEINSGIL